MLTKLNMCGPVGAMSTAVFAPEDYTVIRKQLPDDNMAQANRRKWVTNSIKRMASSPSVFETLFQSSIMGIHPLFAPAAFGHASFFDDHTVFGQYAFVENYIRMSPALVLATLFLTCRRSLRFWYTFMYADEDARQFSGMTDFEDVYIEEDLAKGDALLVKVLGLMTSRVRLEAREMPYYMLASCEPLRAEMALCESKILINQSYFDRRGALHGKTDKLVFEDWLFLAIQLVKSVADALYRTRFGGVPSTSMGKNWKEWMFDDRYFQGPLPNEEIKLLFDWKRWAGQM